MENSIKNIKREAAERQNWRCHYCAFPMWDHHDRRLLQTYGLSKKAARALHCTAEHLTARREGGSDDAGNIAAVCWLCNQRRHQSSPAKSPEEYRAYVQGRVLKGRWHDKSYARLWASVVHPDRDAVRVALP